MRVDLRRTKNGQLKPLSERLSRQQQEQRNLNIAMRREKAIHMGVTASIVSILRRGFFGRMKFFLTGK